MEIGKNRHSLDAGGDQSLGASGAGHVSDISDRPFNVVALAGRLDQGVHFRVVGPDAMVVFHQTADIFAMLVARQRAVVAGSQDAVVFDQHADAVHSGAGRPFRSEHGQLQEIFVPGGPGLGPASWQFIHMLKVLILRHLLF